ncbi:hypothetical protein H9Q13_16360 [Pontibacter sp. JH31]|uniref:Uncharacterized protein n=1 Tax=Pontibacter aquaedesilientis TaxID=2766980 RepID=A0ABR7XKC1_9BACT|nr:hypothetical protein [Pontibacter aquaedesilientis]
MACRFAYPLVYFMLLWQQASGQTLALTASDGEQAALVENTTSKENPLFTDETVLQFRLVVDYQELLKDRGDERGYHQGTLSYTGSAGETFTLPLKVMVRGNRRRDPSVCRFPPLMLNFIRKAMPEGTIFAGSNKIKLVTHCIGEDYVLREYLVYKAYNVLTDQSYRVRLCQVEYVDAAGERKTEQRYAFMIEDDKDMASRNKAKLLSKKVFVRMDRADQKAMARLALFQYMIGNTDWSVPFRHNIDLIYTDPLAPPIPVPFDFDYCGMVAAPYASPPPELGISSVKQRLYRAYAFPENIHREMVNTFNSYRTPIYAVYRQCEPMSRSDLKRSLKYLDSFYKTINNPKKFESKIVKVGERNQKSYVSVKGLQ